MELWIHPCQILFSDFNKFLVSTDSEYQSDTAGTGHEHQSDTADTE